MTVGLPSYVASLVHGPPSPAEFTMLSDDCHTILEDLVKDADTSSEYTKSTYEGFVTRYKYWTAVNDAYEKSGMYLADYLSLHDIPTLTELDNLLSNLLSSTIRQREFQLRLMGVKEEQEEKQKNEKDKKEKEKNEDKKKEKEKEEDKNRRGLVNQLRKWIFKTGPDPSSNSTACIVGDVLEPHCKRSLVCRRMMIDTHIEEILQIVKDLAERILGKECVGKHDIELAQEQFPDARKEISELVEKINVQPRHRDVYFCADTELLIPRRKRAVSIL